MTQPLPHWFGCLFMSSLTARAFVPRRRLDRLSSRPSSTGGRAWAGLPCRAVASARLQTLVYQLVQNRCLPQRCRGRDDS